MTTPTSASEGTASANAPTELPFQAEVQKILSIVINSLYTNNEIFLRELISNASDALDRARFLALTREDVSAQEGSPRIQIRIDEEAHTLTIEDNGIGMTREEAIQNLGTIAHSGTLEFLQAYASAAKEKERVSLIGQFGVGFYASFMVASKVIVHTRSMLPGAECVTWESTGSGTFRVSPGTRAHPGTEITLVLKEDVYQLGKHHRVNEMIQRYSDFVHFPICFGEGVANQSRALWTMPKSQITDEQHAEFFKRVAGHGTPMFKVHTAVDAPVQFYALLYVPEDPPYDLFSRDKSRGVRLYAKRVLIMEHCEQLIPAYLRFLRGVIDSEDLPLNISREMLQQDRLLTQIQQHITKHVLKELKELSVEDSAKYDKLWRKYGRLLKEGLHDDWSNTKVLAELCRFESMKNPPDKLISLSDYVTRMPESQKEIYYLTGTSRRALETSPHIEAFRRRGIDVLFLTDPIDEWAVKGIVAFAERKLKSVTHGEVDLGQEPDAPPEVEIDISGTVDAVKKVLGERVRDVVISKRLTETAACLVSPEGEPGANYERILKAMNKPVVETRRILELNPKHRFVQNLNTLVGRNPNAARVEVWAEMLLDQALLADGVVLDPASVVKRLQDMLVEVSDGVVTGGSS